ncbi:MAG: hypothetical protein ACPGRZ_17640 [Alphaproteobacteria bacterium]
MKSFRQIGAALLGIALLGAGTSAVLADRPKIVNARILLLHENSYEVHVTVGHEDSSWDHYVDRWEVIGPNGKILGTRVLWHPHIGEPMFLRVLRPVTIPPGVKDVIIRVHDKKHGYGHEKLMALPTPKNRDTGVK